MINLVLSGCVTTKQLESSEKNHRKASDYYKNIGQGSASKEELELAKKDEKEYLKFRTILADIFEGDEKK